MVTRLMYFKTSECLSGDYWGHNMEEQKYNFTAIHQWPGDPCRIFDRWVKKTKTIEIWKNLEWGLSKRQQSIRTTWPPKTPTIQESSAKACLQCVVVDIDKPMKHWGNIVRPGENTVDSLHRIFCGWIPILGCKANFTVSRYGAFNVTGRICITEERMKGQIYYNVHY